MNDGSYLAKGFTVKAVLSPPVLRRVLESLQLAQQHLCAAALILKGELSRARLCCYRYLYCLYLSFKYSDLK